MAKTVSIDQLGNAIAQELTTYHKNVVEKLNVESEKAVKELVQKTKAAAPVGARGSFKRNISSKLLEERDRGNKYVWYVKAPDHRLTHLLANGHATKDGGRTRADPFLANAVSEVLPKYEKAVKEVIQNGK